MPSDPFDLWIFDADGTLRRTTVPGQPCPRRDGEWELLPGVRERLAGIAGSREGPPRFGIASNQDQVGYGLFSEASARELLRALARAALGFEPPPEAIRLCPHRPEDACDCRKPKPGMLREIMRYYGVGPDRTVFVGDSDDDRRAALEAGVAFLPAGEWLNSTVEPSGRRSRRTPPRVSADSYDAGACRTTRE
ncbi:MAG TPA: HAD-IIIA family hydrolase [Gemmatimonadales bacterium]|nr:HAD-IIIA family hydrolase [Gemmatimonadales bacterium]